MRYFVQEVYKFNKLINNLISKSCYYLLAITREILYFNTHRKAEIQFRNKKADILFMNHFIDNKNSFECDDKEPGRR